MLLWTEVYFVYSEFFFIFVLLWPRICSILWITPWTLQRICVLLFEAMCSVIVNKVNWTDSYSGLSCFTEFLSIWCYYWESGMKNFFVCSLCKSLLFNALSCRSLSLVSNSQLDLRSTLSLPGYSQSSKLVMQHVPTGLRSFLSLLWDYCYLLPDVQCFENGRFIYFVSFLTVSGGKWMQFLVFHFDKCRQPYQ